MTATYLYNSPIGVFEVSEGMNGVRSVRPVRDVRHVHDVRRVTPVTQWLDAYFAGESLPLPALCPEGTDFCGHVWTFLMSVRFGTTVTYGEIARALGTSPRAVGQAVHRNPIAILIPCHRVVGANGALTGYAWGLEMKSRLLEHEGIILNLK